MDAANKNLALLNSITLVNLGIMGISFVSIMLSNYDFNTSNIAYLFGFYGAMASSIIGYVFFSSFLLRGILKFKREKLSLTNITTKKNLRQGITLNTIATIVIIAGFYLGSYTAPREDSPILSIRPYFLPSLIVLFIGAIIFYKSYKVYKSVKNEQIQKPFLSPKFQS